VYHGIEKLPNGGQVKIHGHTQGDTIVISVWNAIADGEHYREREGNRIALENIRQRLELAWPRRTRVDVQQQASHFEVTLTFPFASTHSPQTR
jgi:two-component system sensor histidine kinase AlgZ